LEMSEARVYCVSDLYHSMQANVHVVRAEDYSAAQSELAALREELAVLQTKHERTESALNGSMKALTRVDNMWKKRWLDKTGEAAMALVVDDEFKALFEEIKDYRQRLADAERQNGELVELLREVVELPGVRSFRPRALWPKVDAALTKPEEAASDA